MPRQPHILIWNRPHALQIPGGDTVVMRRLIDMLSARGCRVSVYPEFDPCEIDLVHLINLTVASVSREAAQFCREFQKPLVITTLFEDWPRYLVPSLHCIPLFNEYLSNGRNEEIFTQRCASLRLTPPGPEVGLADVVASASLLFVCAPSEADRLSRSYENSAEKTIVCPFGVTVPGECSPDELDAVRTELGFDQFVLCVGRLESRKNQLMLIKALEHEDVPIVLAAGKASVQPVYGKLIERFTRKSPVKIARFLEAGRFSALMQCATAHVLPSWFELPGLVTLEAAARGTPVVASSWGAITDYLPQSNLELCEPDNPESIREAVIRATKQQRSEQLKAAAGFWTWDRFTELTCAGYEHVLANMRRSATAQSCSHTTQTRQLPNTETEMSEHANPNYKFDASIIIPCFNRADLTQRCLNAICEMADAATYEVIIIDNGSTDGTSKLIAAMEGDVKVLRNSQNRGFAAACNQGARLAEGEFLVFLNNDTAPKSGWLDALIAVAREHSDAGAVGARLLFPEGTVQHAGVAFNSKGIPYHIFQNFAQDHPAVLEKRIMQAVTAACMLAPTDIFSKTGGFDEGYVNGFEDIDYCLRLKQHGLRVIYCPNAVVIHHEESSAGRKDHDKHNLDRFINRWQHEVRPDEDTYLSKFGLRIDWNSGRGTYTERPAEAVDNQPAATNGANNGDLDRAKQLYADGDYEEAANLLKQVVESKLTLAGEGEFESWQTLGNCFARLSKTPEAEQAFNTAMKLNPDSERPFLGLGAIAMLEENWLAAQYSFMIALAKNPDSLKGEFGVGMSLASRRRHAEAVQRFRKVVENEPDNAEALFYLYRSTMEGGIPEISIPYLESYLERYPSDATFQFHLCGAYWKSGQLIRAVESCQTVMNLDPRNESAKSVMQHLETTLGAHV